MTKTRFINDLEIGWDYAIWVLLGQTICDDNKNIKALCEVYQSAYRTDDYKKTNHPDDGLCYKIRKFAIDNIIENLEE